MKKMKKLLSLVLSVAMVVAMGITTFAAGQTFTITAPATDHQYEIYQIFTGDLSGKTLSNVKWGKNGTGKTGDAVDEATLNTLTGVNVAGKSDKEKLAVIEGYAKLSDPVATISNGNTYTAAAGYYLIKDKDTSLAGKDDSYTTYIVEVVGDVTISPKSNKPSSEKKVKDTNDTTGETTGWQDSADYDIGDQVPFQLKGTVAANYGSYTTYKFTFHDAQSKGLTFNAASVKAYVDSKEISTDYYTVSTTPATETEGEKIDITFSNLKDIADVQANSVITVEYTSELNTGAVIGSTGNPNTMHLEYSNNPNTGHEGETGTTPDDTVIVFTYKTVINKVDENGNALTGAEFILEKKIKGENGNADTWREITAVKNTEGTTFTFSGLDDGEYRLRETQTPSKYNTIDDITFEITATHDVLSDNPALTKLNGNKLTGVITFTENETEGSLTANVVNKKGSILPSTGGIGTTIFYVIGGILMVGAGVILVSRRRRSK